MDWLYRELSGLLLPDPSKGGDDDIIAINNLPNPPPVPVTARDVQIRRCRLAGDAVDAGFGRFRTADLPRLLQLVQGAPALVGHRKEGLGVARFFGGSLEKDDRTGITYVVPKFYWMRAHSAAEDLRVNIDGGIWCEASLGFSFRRPTCSVCGEDVRRCDHTPGRDYDGSAAYFYYDDILKVYEGSFVFRGAQPGTGFALAAPNGQMPVKVHRFRYRGEWYEVSE
ncbi:MAG: hypothetical protein FJY67_01840 [Calditrichaeota bacterium]|nr:hypothetical protein [Calditrichota bacterium]